MIYIVIFNSQDFPYITVSFTVFICGCITNVTSFLKCRLCVLLAHHLGITKFIIFLRMSFSIGGGIRVIVAQVFESRLSVNTGH